MIDKEGRMIITIYAPMIYTAPCVMLLMREHPLQGKVAEDWALEIESLVGPVKWHRADRRVPFGLVHIGYIARLSQWGEGGVFYLFI